MRKIILLSLTAFCAGINIQAQYWQQQVNYTIDVSLNDKEHTLDGFEKIEYINNSPDTLQFIWFHLWPNAYKNDKTAYTDQSLVNGSTKFYFSDKEDRGYINRLEFRVNEQTARLEDHPQYIDIAKLVLPAPLLPGQKINISTPFHVKLPLNFNRGGHTEQNYYIAHWFPKPAVYDKKGWHPIPMLEQGEFYSEFGNFDVHITLPENYAVAATGELQNEDEKNWLSKRSAFTWKPETEKIKVNGVTKLIIQEFPTSSSKTKTLHYLQNNVHDFAWFADKRFIVKTDTLQLGSGRKVECYSFFVKDQPHWQNSISYIKNAIKSKSELVGEYPYNTAAVVQNTESSSGGTEYPTITILDAPNTSMLEYIINHEIGHYWFYGILATNERDFPWMDEGINSYYDSRYMSANPDAGIIKKEPTGNINIEHLEDLLLNTRIAIKKDQPIELTSNEYSPINYNLVVYRKTALWMKLIENKLGTPVFDKAMQEYFKRWQFKHPYPEDLKKIFEEVSEKNLDQEFALLGKKGSLSETEKEKWKIIIPFSPTTATAYIKQPSINALIFTPLAGFNSYDKFMIGAAITNYKLPANRFQFFFAPLYSTGVKKLNGLGRINYSFYPSATFSKIDLFVNGSSFSMNQFNKTDGGKAIAGFTKLAPGIRFTLDEKDSRSTRNRYIQFKSYFINEGSFNISYDSLFTGTDTIINQVVNINKRDRNLQQLKIVQQDFRTLYPYKAELNLEHGTDFLRAAFTGNYFFNYSKEGGLDVRLFAGKFFYLGSKTFSKKFTTQRYHLNMTGADGFEDYTYSDYFIGRNKFEGIASQQIMQRDGAFKVRTDLYAEKVGKTDSWLTAINLSTTIPKGMNPLSVLPVKIPLKLFADIGTYGDAWKKNADLDRFVFDAGLQVSLLANTVNIYVPLLYSKIYKDYIQSIIEKKGRIWKTISFSIDISNFSLRKINRDIDF